MGNQIQPNFTISIISDRNRNDHELTNFSENLPDNAILGCMTYDQIDSLRSKYPEYSFITDAKCISGHIVYANRNTYNGDMDSCCTMGHPSNQDPLRVITCDPTTLNPGRFSTCDVTLVPLCQPDNSASICQTWIAGLITRTSMGSSGVLDTVIDTFSEYCKNHLNEPQCREWVLAVRNSSLSNDIADAVVTHYCLNIDPTKCKCIYPIQGILDLQKTTTVNQVCWNRDCVFGDHRYFDTKTIELQSQCTVSNCVISISDIDSRKSNNIYIDSGCSDVFSTSRRDQSVSVRNTILPSAIFELDTNFVIYGLIIIMLLLALFAIPGTTKSNYFVKEIILPINKEIIYNLL